MTAPRTAFVFATPMEAAPLVGALGPRAGATADTYDAGEFVIAVSGMGLACAGAAVARLAARGGLRRVVNLGIAGSLTRALAPGDLVQVGAVTSDAADADYLATTTLALVAPVAPCRARLISRATPVFDATLKARLSARADVVDMEAHAIAEQCAPLDVECVVLKSISDDATDRAMLHANLERASRRLADYVLAHLAELT